MQPGNSSPDERPRPRSVPAGAYWDASDNEWVLPEKNAAGQFHGLVKWWRPDGTLCCVTEHVAGKPHGAFTRYHENGEPSRTGTFVRGTLHGTNVFTRSTAPTTENFPSGLGKHIWRCEMDFVDGRMAEGRLFDREGRRVMEDGTPFPTARPPGVPDAAHFREVDGDHVWVHGETRQVGDAWHRIGTWRYWDADGVLVSEERYENGERVFDRPSGVPEDATFDADEEVWTQAPPGGDGERRTWTASGVLRSSETYQGGDIVRVREYLDDGSLAQDSTLVDGGVPVRKWFRRTDDEELASFPNIDADDGREVEYLFDEHGRMTMFMIMDAGGTVLEKQDVYRNAYGDEDQTPFDSIDDASQAWIAEGERYTSELNRWLHELYTQDEPSFEEPTFDRHDLERGVIDSVAALNARGEGARAKFPLYFDGIGKAFWDRYGLVVDRVLAAGDATYARVRYPTQRPPDVFRITGDAIAPVADVLAIGSSHDKQYLAFAYDDRIEIEHGGERIRVAYPTRFQHAAADRLPHALSSGRAMIVQSLRVLPNGRDVLLVTAEGIYIAGTGGAQRLYPLDATLDAYASEYASDHDGGAFRLKMHFGNADVDASGTRITCGGMFRRGIMAGLAMFRRADGDTWTLENTSQNDAFFPAQAVFHRTRPHVAFAATLYASLHNSLANTTFRIDLDGLAPGPIEELAGGIARERGRVQAIASFGKGFLLGFDNGYIRWMGVDDNAELLGYVFVGGSIQDIDVAADGRSFVVASDAGLVSRFVLADEPSSNLITTMPLADASRTAFFRTWPPLRW